MSCTWSVSVWAVRPPLPPSHPARLPGMWKWCIKDPRGEIFIAISNGTVYPQKHKIRSLIFLILQSLQKQSNEFQVFKGINLICHRRQINLPHHTSSANSDSPLGWRDLQSFEFLGAKSNTPSLKGPRARDRSNWARQRDETKALANQPVTGPMVFLIILLVFWQ